MNEEEMRNVMVNSVSISVAQLTDLELAGLNLCAQLGLNPKDKEWYPKVDYLFDQADGTKMHEETKIALGKVVTYRLSKANV